MLCTIARPQRPAALRELRRVLRPEGDLGLLVFVACGPLPGPLPEGNDFPTEEALLELLDETGFSVVQSMESDWARAGPGGLAGARRCSGRVLARRHGDDPRWQRAEEQTARISRPIGGGHVRRAAGHGPARAPLAPISVASDRRFGRVRVG